MRTATAALATTLLAGAAGAQPFQGTAFMSPRILTAADPSAVRSVEYAGRGERVIWNYRVMDWITVDAYLFDARIGARDVEFQVNPEFGSEAAARVEVDAYVADIGRLPAVLLSNLAKVHVNAGRPAHPEAATFQPRRVFGGNRFDRSITIHTGTGEEYRQSGFLEEVLFHEGAHVSVDGDVVDDPAWHAAQQADGGFISDYARDNPDREDVAESILPYFAVRFRPGRLPPRAASGHRRGDPRAARVLRCPGLRLEPLHAGGPRAPRSRGRASRRGPRRHQPEAPMTRLGASTWSPAWSRPLDPWPAGRSMRSAWNTPSGDVEHGFRRSGTLVGARRR